LCLWTEDEEDGWLGNRKIDYLRRRMGTNKFSILCTTSDDCQVWKLDCKKFVLGKCICHNTEEIDGIILALKKTKEGSRILEIILSFVDSRHNFQDALKLAKKWLKTTFLDEFAWPS
jgi:hypothetical protein